MRGKKKRKWLEKKHVPFSTFKKRNLEGHIFIALFSNLNFRKIFLCIECLVAFSGWQLCFSGFICPLLFTKKKILTKICLNSSLRCDFKWAGKHKHKCFNWNLRSLEIDCPFLKITETDIWLWILPRYLNFIQVDRNPLLILQVSHLWSSVRNCLIHCSAPFYLLEF